MRAVRPILAGGSIAGTLDLLAAFAIGAGFGSSPARVLQGIATGLLGAAAFDGGARAAALGLACHFVIAFGAAAVYYAASRLVPSLARRPLAFGALYGIVVYAVMAFVVVPLSKAAPRSTAWYMVLTMIVVHVACVGVPIALATSRAPSRPIAVPATS
ncbi:MAG TPA: hypothetical protein VGF40_12210 [Thermoanaerobaculia bacterium]